MSERPRSRVAFRRVERWLVGLVMAVIAFVLERAVLRSIKKGQTVPTLPGETAAGPIATSKGTEVSG